MKTAKAKLTENGDRLSLTITSDESPIAIAIRLDASTACGLIFELLAAYKENPNGSCEFTIHGQPLFLEYAQWDAAYKVLEQWYDVYIEEVILTRYPNF